MGRMIAEQMPPARPPPLGLGQPLSFVVAVLGDGATGFALGDLDTLVRHNLQVVLIVGNNGIWGLETHPMRAVYG